MVFGAIIAAGFGTLGGLTAGSYIFSSGKDPKSYKFLHQSADHDDTIAYPKVVGSVPGNMRELLQYTPAWLSWPDYDKVTMANRITATMWPYLDKAIMAEVLRQTIPVIDQVKTQIPGGLLERIEFHTDDFTMGTVPLRLGGVKVYSTQDDEAILEAPAIWGSNARFHVTAHLRVGPAAIKVPVQVSNIQMQATARVTFKPLVETIPCLGGMTISLLDVPHVDMEMKLIKQVDLMAVPGIKEAVRMAVKMVLEGMMIYPNSMAFPIMTNYGVSPPPRGTLQVTLVSCNLPEGGIFSGKLKPYFKFEVREGRGIRSSTKQGNHCSFHEQFNLVVDDPFSQELKVILKEDDMGWQDALLGTGHVLLTTTRYDPQEKRDVQVEADFIRNPKREVEHEVPLYKPKGPGMMVGAAGGMAKVATLGLYKGPTGKAQASTESAGSVLVRLRFIPFSQPTLDDDEEDDAAAAAAAAAVIAPTRSVNARIHANLKGVLTVKLIRCVDLGDEAVDAYVTMRLVDPDPNVEDVVQHSAVVYNEASPRWGDKFDFVMVKAMSTLQLSVMDKTTAMESMMSLKLTKRFEDKQLGKLNVPVADVARNGRLKDTFTLSEADKGSVELQLDWYTCHFSD